MSMKMIGGLVAFVMGTVVGGCSGADTQKPDTASQDPADTSSGASGANLPPSSGTKSSGGAAATPGTTPGTPQGAPAAGGAALPGAAPGGAAPGGMAGGQNGAPGQPGAGAGGGAPGAGGAGNDVCCYNNTAYDCPDVKSCLGGFDVDACEAACADGDFNCEIACVDMLGKAGGPTNACVAKGPC